MKFQLAYCSACDHDVRIALSDPSQFDGQANLPDPEIVCLEMGERCSGALCPVGAQPPTVMAARLIRSGLKPIVQPVVAALCESCQQLTQYAVIDATYATCTQCGRTLERRRLSMPTSN